MFGLSDKDFLAFAIGIALVGWGVVEGILWVLSHVSIAWN